MDTTIKNLLADLAQLGITLRIERGNLRCAPTERLTDDLRVRIRNAKADLVRAFEGHAGSNSQRTLTEGTDKTARSPKADPFVSSVSSSLEASGEIRATGSESPASPRPEIESVSDEAPSEASATLVAVEPVEGQAGEQPRPQRRARTGRPPNFSKVPKEGTDKTDKSPSVDPSGSFVSSPARASAHSRAPLTPCRACGSPTFWAMKGGATWICNGCHKTDFQPDQVEWHVVEDARRIMAVTRPKIGCPKCKFSGFVTLVGGRWTVCVCNDGFERRVAGETDRGVA